MEGISIEETHSDYGELVFYILFVLGITEIDFRR